jgi:L-ribulose-5-phosphate 3-epimerase
MPFTRRELLAGSVAALAADRLPASPSSPAIARVDAPFPWHEPKRPPWHPKKAVKIGMVQIEGPLLDRFRLLRDCGFDGVELDSPGDLDLDAARHAAERCELVIHGVVDSLHWAQPLSDPDAAVRDAGRGALEQALRDAKALGATSVLLVPAVVKQDVAYQDAWVRSQAEIKKVLPQAAELGIDILIENVWNKFLLGPLELARYLDELAHPRIGSYFDPGNLVQFGWPEHWVPILAHRIRKVDVKDYKRGRLGYEGFDIELNDGEAAWPRIVKALRSIGYSGWFTAEMRGGDREYLTDLAKRMDQFLAS